MYSTLSPVLKRLTLAASVALAVAGCTTVGSDFSAPHNIAGTEGAYHLPAGQSASEARLPAQWWNVFGDATLDQLEQTALRDNPGVKAAGQRLLQAQAQAGVARSNQSVQGGVSASVSNSRSSANSAQCIAFGHQSISGNDYEVGASLSYEVDLFGRVRRMVEASDSQVLASEADRDGVLLLLSSQVATTYWQIRGLNAGLSNELDTSRARIERANAEADLHGVQRQRNQLEHSLATLVGGSPTSTMLPALANGVLPQPPAIPVGLPASLLSQRPDLAGSVANLRSANAQIGVAESAFYPSISLTGDFGFASENLRDLAKGGSRQFSIGPLALSLPIFDGGRNKSNLALAKARYEEAIDNHDTKLLTALREVEDALSDVQEKQAQSTAQAQAKQAAARAYLVARRAT